MNILYSKSDKLSVFKDKWVGGGIVYYMQLKIQISVLVYWSGELNSAFW